MVVENLFRVNLFLRKFLPVVLLLAPFSLAQAEVVDIDSAMLQALIKEDIPVVDVRRIDEWNHTGIIARSHLLTFFDENGGHDASEWLNNLSAIASVGEPVILICRTGHRTGLIGQWLSEKQGYTKAYNVAKGILSWKKDGGQTVAP